MARVSLDLVDFVYFRDPDGHRVAARPRWPSVPTRLSSFQAG
jgi:hypothetical protein